jgi:GT2 family glycosyltransferase
MNGVAIIIVNYRTADLVVQCLRSLAEEVRAIPGCRVVVVDNDSRDGSAAKLRAAIAAEGWSAWVELVPLDRNLGFAGGNNAAIRPLLSADHPPDYVLLLNPDTYIRTGAVRSLVEFMERHPRVGLAGGRNEDADGNPIRSAFRFFTLRSELEDGLRLGLVSRFLRNSLVAPPVRDDEHQVDWVAGACLAVRRAVFDAVGLLDEGYFLYYEEVDFCLRARRAGWPCWYVPGSRIVHLVGQSTGVTDGRASPRRRPRYWFASRRRYFVKNHGRLYTMAIDVTWAVSFAFWRLRRWILGKPDTDPPHLLSDYLRFNFLGGWRAKSTPLVSESVHGTVRKLLAQGAPTSEGRSE